MSEGKTRREFFNSLALVPVGVIAGKVFGSMFLENGKIVEVPEGHYDPARKLYVSSATGEPVFKGTTRASAASDQTGIWTDEVTTSCTTMWYPKDGPPQCLQSDTSTDRHPDGFQKDN